MHLIQILLPLYDNTGVSFPKIHYDAVRTQLTEQFGGLTMYLQSPAVGLWKDDAENTIRDEVIIFEVMSTQVDHTWWQVYCQRLRKQFRQDEILVRASEVQLLGQN
jgi:hypothetical protein